MKYFFTIFFILIIIFSCKKSSHNKYTPLIAKDTTYEDERNNNLFVFVGEKISITEIPNDGGMDEAFNCRYKILQWVYGNYESDTIEFIAYDHHGQTPLLKYKNCMLYVVKYNGKYYHEKYMYTDVYKTIDRKWAGTYHESYYDYDTSYEVTTGIKPRIIDFAHPVTYSSMDSTDNFYPLPFFKRVGDSAVAVYGFYIDELFTLKKNGILTRRKLFGDSALRCKRFGAPVEVQLEKVTERQKVVYDKNDLKFIDFFKIFKTIIKANDKAKLKSIMFDSLYVSDSILTANKFIKKCYTKVFNKHLMAKWDKKSMVEYTWRPATSTLGLLACAQQRIIKTKDIYRCRTITINGLGDKENSYSVYLSFVETKNGFKLYGCGNSSDVEYYP